MRNLLVTFDNGLKGEGYVCVCLCVFVNTKALKSTDGFALNFQGRRILGQGQNDYISSTSCPGEVLSFSPVRTFYRLT